MPELVTFAVLSGFLLFFTLRRPYRHRFYRFFAFESILGLVLRQARFWFSDPLSPVQVLSWAFLAGSLLLALHAIHQLRSFGEPEGDIETTTRLVARGAYRLIRHPLYGSLLLAGVGAFLKNMEFVSFLLLSCLSIFIFSTARTEEQENLNRFGAAYREYMQKTRRFIPFIF